LPAAAVRGHLGAHVKATTVQGQAWTVTIGALSLGQSEQTARRKTLS